MEFNHETEKISEAIPGADTPTMDTLCNEILTEPDAVIGKRASEFAEWVYDNVEDPSALAVMAVMMRQGIIKMREEALEEHKKSMRDPEAKEALELAKKVTGGDIDMSDLERVLMLLEKLKKS